MPSRPAVDEWKRYERIMPGFRERMMRARADLEAGRGNILNADLALTPVEAIATQTPSPTEGSSGNITGAEVWRRLGEKPGFNETLQQGIKDINEGRERPLEDLHRERPAERPHQE